VVEPHFAASKVEAGTAQRLWLADEISDFGGRPQAMSLAL
jgi:hypothetical protein